MLPTRAMRNAMTGVPYYIGVIAIEMPLTFRRCGGVTKKKNPKVARQIRLRSDE